MLLYLLGACAPLETAKIAEETCNPESDEDGDGIDACVEATLGTLDTEIDSDGDGSTDAEELDCLSDPADANEACYLCGWNRADPGNIQTNGTEDGDVIENVQFVDQCGESVPLYDFADGYNVLFMTTEWCGACAQEVGELDEKADMFHERYGFEVRYLIALFEDNASQIPSPEVASAFAERTEMERFPVLADINGRLIGSTPYEGLQLPGKCALTPEMEILGCATGSAAEEYVFSLIVEHAEE